MPPASLGVLRRPILLATALATAGAAFSAVPPATAQSSGTTVQMSVATGGFAPGWGTNGDSSDEERRLVSDNGRYVVMAASGPVVPGQKQINWQIVRRDRALGTTTLISKSTTGAMGNGQSYEPSVSADGQVIAFGSSSSNLVPGDTNDDTDIFVHDVRAGTTKRVSVTSAGAQVNETGSKNMVGPPSISANGRYVGFAATVAGLVPGDSTNSNGYLHDRQTGSIDVVSRDHAGAVAAAYVGTSVSVSADGNRVAFLGASNLVPGTSGIGMKVYVRDRAAGTTTSLGGDFFGSADHTISANGRYVAFRSEVSDLVPNDTNAKLDVFIHDLDAPGGVTRTRIMGLGGQQPDGDSIQPSLSKDGRYVAFKSTATNLVSGDTNGKADVFRHDRTTGTTIRTSLAANGKQHTSDGDAPSISGDGQHITFEAYGSTLTPVKTSGYRQVYVRDLAGKYPALFARAGALPARVHRNSTYRIATSDIRTGPALVATWTPTGKTKGPAIRRTHAISGNAFTLEAPSRYGTYRVSVSYSGHELRSRTVQVLKPTARKLPAKVKAGKRIKIKTVGLNPRDKVQVQFKPRGKTVGKAVKRTGKVNKAGVLKVKTPPRRGTFRVIVRSKGEVLRKGNIRLR